VRLTHLKLAGFKSFVDPTTLHIHGQRVGVVGPNGCGKSNVMESVRWVLGESSAREMRGDSMSDVIFNGSGNRKAIARASVELIFDNSLGGASGEWSQYAEISVRRVIEREKGSSYYINNTLVRRRDVADLFLGTGLGGRAYAIIGQNTISRIVEAKPEEMRVFLEEAAGISKYKERRRETELRLRDTRENLIRIQDVRSEIDKQITRLEAQALITEQYHSLQHTLKQTQGQLWLLKKREASLAWEKAERTVEKLVNELESQMAALRKTEALVEELRQQHYASSEALQLAQTHYYETNAQVSNLENQVKHTQEARERLLQQMQQMQTQAQKLELQSETFSANLQQLMLEQSASQQDNALAQQQLSQAQAALPMAEKAHSEAQQAHIREQKTLMDTEQQIRLENTNLDHIQRQLTQQQQRLQRLQQELTQLVLPEGNKINDKRATLQALKQDSTSLEQQIQSLNLAEKQHQQNIQTARQQQLSDERAWAQIAAQIASLEKIQASIGQEAQLGAWIKQSGLNAQARFWQHIRVEKGWETALEAVLGQKLNALVQHQALNIQQRPPAALVLCFTDKYESKQLDASTSSYPRLRDFITVDEPSFGIILDHWLHQVYVTSNPNIAQEPAHDLAVGALLVNQQGDCRNQYSVSFYAAQSALHGVLERQRELDALQQQTPALEQKVATGTAHIQAFEQQLRETQAQLQALQQQLRLATQNQHQVQLEIQREEQQLQHLQDKQRSLQQEIESLNQTINHLNEEHQLKLHVKTSAQDSLQLMQEQTAQALQRRQQAEHSLRQVRDSLQQAERQAQEKIFNEKLITNNINELNNKLQTLNEEKQSLSMRQKEVEAMLEAAKMEGLQTNLALAISLKQQHEQDLAQARHHLAEAEQVLQAQERNRMQNEQMQHPLRDKLEQARLGEQQARLHFEQCQAGLNQMQLDESALAASLNAHSKISDLEQAGLALQQKITDLGAVNLGAIQELASERERKFYLDSQADDLEQAIQTLEDAIRRIDKETRARLQHTFDEANRHFSELFITLFGGGQAKLELLGEEILDTGIQVFAQPPGKKNSTIHLLSGGEKALTALALVFALFKLNPAPFCLMDEVDAPLDDSNTERFCSMVKKMSERTQFLFVSHNKITMEMAQQLIGVTMQESGVSRIVEVDMEAAMQMQTTLFTH
jgi:chromosome segregation protein